MQKLNTIQQSIRDDFIADRETMLTAGYRATVRRLFVELDTLDDIEVVVFETINTDYDPQDCKDNKKLNRAYRSLCEATQDIGAESDTVDKFGAAVVFSYGKPKEGVRSLSVSLVSEKELAIQAERKAEDKRIREERKQQDLDLAEETRQAELAALTDIDVFLRIQKYIKDTYHNDPQAVIAAGMAWYAQQAEQAELAKSAKSAKKVA